MPRRSKSTTTAPAARRGRELPVDLMPHVFEYMGDAFDVARCAAHQLEMDLQQKPHVLCPARDKS